MSKGHYEVDYAAVLEHARVLTTQFPDRYAGTDRASAAADYIESVCKGYGIPCELLRPPMYVSIPIESRIEVLTDRTMEVPSVPFANSGATSEQGVEAEVVFLGPGAETDFARQSVEGKIALVESSYSPPRQEKIRLAAKHGAVGIMVMHWGESDSELMVRGNAKAVWGNPTLDDLPNLPRIPAIGISRRTGVQLAKAVSAGGLRCRLHARAEQRWSDEALLPLIRIPGNARRDEIVVIGGHYDSWSGGATDNAVGNGFKIELARRLFERRSELERSVWVAFWPGHETTTMSGSTWFVDHFWDELNRGGAVYINVDTLGLAGSSEMLIHCSPELGPFAAQVARETLGEDPNVLALARTGDQSFFGIGIPSMYGRTGYTADVLKETHNATLGWWNHSHPSQDTMDKVDPEMVEKAGVVMENWVRGYVNVPELPGDYSLVLQDVCSRLKDLDEAAPTDLRLAELARKAEALLGQLTQLEAARSRLTVDELNRGTLRLARKLTAAFASASGRYGQDPYGLSALKTRLPGLYGVQDLSDHPEPDALLTGLLRERNRIADALSDAMDVVQPLLARTQG